ncbi:MAG TPA: STAS domain-containing protein [Verrucomicrobiae bacterium]|jgi:anti-anti-sigma factor|nr:STAS domain-containing protein [Verrucomicrobiae bacterium]
MSTPSANLKVLVGKDFACVKIAGRANFTSSPDFKTLLAELAQKGYTRFIIDLSNCVLMDSTFLGVLSGFGLKLNPSGAPGKSGVELLNANDRVAELLENLGAIHLFKVTSGVLELPDDVKTSTPESVNPTREEITRTSLEAHQTLMEVNPDNFARFKDVAQFLAEDLKNLEKSS